ncbi:DUF2085 domain-containing protein [Oscillochloris sp. ZM17-4]|uniref:DUF2085 domain-containing protein n=1 Tax=Oscillochloris sp. ZM17-4 TaxID=2866714 RepID=UPI001C739363|nr:DUF2085 domain-containing protein [Oscillochloris sp. ZM17-4]MBX0328059.1 DUF2085 domain-containing protein [Oscillochloris sp. ZM17-4]
MSENSADEVIRLAQQQIAERQERAALEQITQVEGRLRREVPWRWIFAGVGALLLVALLFSPGVPLQWKMYAVVHGVCAQQHNIFLGGMQFPLCARNSGIYMSFLLTLGYIYAIGRGRAGRVPPWPISVALILFVVFMGVDGFNSLFVDIGQPSLYAPDNFLRTLTGMGMGISIAVMLHIVLNMTLRKDVEDGVPVLRSWWELLGIMAIDLLALAAIYANLGFMFWPLAFAAFFGITGVLYLVSLLLTSLFMGYEGKITSIRQLARPATVAIIPTLIILGAMSYLRFWLESLGLIL